MKLKVYTVKDLAVQAFLVPFFARSDGEAKRSFWEACRDPQHQFGKYLADYELYYLGEWEDVEGVAELSAPQFVCRAKDLRLQEDTNLGT